MANCGAEQLTVSLINGQIVNSPVALDELITVACPDLINERRQVYGAMTYRPHIAADGGLRIPVRGDRALIAVDTDGDPWITDWTPTAGLAVGNFQNGLDTRLDVIEGRVRSFSFSGVPSVDLGTYDGDNITGIRISGALRFTFTSNGIIAVFSLRPNGLTSIPRQATTQRSFWDGTTATTDLTFTGASAAGQDGIFIAASDWVSNSGQLNGIWFDGIFFTKRTAGNTTHRNYLGHYSNNDYSANNDRNVQGVVSSRWLDVSTALTSLTFAITNAGGTIEGKICTEVIP